MRTAHKAGIALALSAGAAWASSPYILSAEQRLASLGYAPGAVDGMFDEQLQTALRTFQAGNGLPVSGLLSNDTYNLLMSPAAARSAAGAATPMPMPTPSAVESVPVGALGTGNENMPVAFEPPAATISSPNPPTPGYDGKRRFGVVASAALEFGGDELVTVEFSDGSDEELTAGEGFRADVGGYFRPIPEVELKATVGYKYAATEASNLDLTFTRVAFEFTGHYRLPKDFHVGGGLAYHTGVEFEVDGDLGEGKVEFDDAVGYVAEIGWRWFSATYTGIDYEVDGEEVDGSNAGIRFTYRF